MKTSILIKIDNYSDLIKQNRQRIKTTRRLIPDYTNFPNLYNLHLSRLSLYKEIDIRLRNRLKQLIYES